MPLEIEYARAARIDLYEIWYFIAADNRRAADNLIRRFEAIFATWPQIRRSAGCERNSAGTFGASHTAAI